MSSSGGAEEGDESTSHEDDDIGAGSQGREDEDEMECVEQVVEQAINIVDESDMEMQNAVSVGRCEDDEDD